jgi:hypothetical protein
MGAKWEDEVQERGICEKYIGGIEMRRGTMNGICWLHF